MQFLLSPRFIEEKLTQQHIRDLRSAALTDDQILQTGHFSAAATTAQKLLQMHHLPAGLIFNYCDPNGAPYQQANGDRFWRIKPDWDDPELPKYLSPPGSGNRPYFSRLQANWSKILGSPRQSLIEVEGEKKADCLCAHGLPTIGLAGVWGWVDQTPRPNEAPLAASRVLPELERIEYRNRTVYQCFDSDIVVKSSVQQALLERALHLQELGADPLLVRLPNELDGSKNGPDDFVLRHGIDAFQVLVKAAQPSVILKRKKPLINLPEPNSHDKALLAWSVLKEHWAYRPGVGWYEWQGSHWELRSIEEFERCLTQFMDAQLWRHCENSTLTSIVRQLRSRLLIPHLWWGNDDHLAFANGTLDIRSDQFTPGHDPQHYLTAALPYDFDPQAKCPRWLQFLSEATGQDQRLIDLLQALCRYAVVPKAKHRKAQIEKSFDLFGPKGTGKGTFLDVLIQLVGENNTGPASPDTFKTPQGLGQLIDKKLAVDTDCTGFLERIGAYNKVVSNEPVEVKKLYRDPCSQRLGVVVVRAYNQFIAVPDGSEGLDRRLTVIPFQQRPRSLDVELGEKLRAELTGIFAWAWSLGEAEMKQRILWAGSIPAVAAANLERFEANHPEYRFLSEHCPGGTDKIQAGHLYAAYVEWCRANGHQPKSQVKFRPAIEALGCKRSDKTNGLYFYSVPIMQQFSVADHLGIVPDQGEMQDGSQDGSTPDGSSDRESWGELSDQALSVDSEDQDLAPEEDPSTSIPTPELEGDPTVSQPSLSLGNLSQCPLDRPRWQVGDWVHYIGSNPHYRKQYGEPMIIHALREGYVNCRLAGGRLSTWINPSDLEAVPFHSR